MAHDDQPECIDSRRRRLLQGTVAGIVVAPAFIRGAHGNTVHEGTSLFPLGVASGDPDHDSVVLWTRLVEDPLTGAGLSQRPFQLGWEVATDPGMLNVVCRGEAVAHPENGHAVRVIARGLPPNAWLWFRFYGKGRIRGHESRIGRTRTFPSAYSCGGGRGRRRGRWPSWHGGGDECRVESMRFAVVSCQNYAQGYFPAWRDIAEQDLDYVVHTGDYIYEGAAGSPVLDGRDHVGREIFTVDEYRNRYALYRLDADLQAAHAQFPFIVTWDDHEVDNNYAAFVAEQGAPYQDEAFRQRRRNAYRVYGESMPLRRVDASWRHGGRDSFPLFRRLQFGRLADIHVLDTRQYRSDQPAGDGFGSTDRDIDPGTAALLEQVFQEALFDPDGIENPAASLLGYRQELWLALNLIRSRSRWNVLAQQVMLTPWNLKTTAQLTVQFGDDFPGRDEVVAAIGTVRDFLNVDAWDGVQAGRRRLVRLLEALRPGSPVVLTGDIHSAWGADLYADDGRQGDVVAAEFVCTSISSTFLGVDPRPTDAIVRAGVIADNPQIRYFDGRFRGYCLCDVDDRRWQTTYRGVADLERATDLADELALVPMPGDPVQTTAVASIPAGFNERTDNRGLDVSITIPA